jgi:RND family efflux transporter MFP subunit
MIARSISATRVAMALVLVVAAAGCAKPVEKADAARWARVMTVRASGGDDVTLFAGEVKPRYETDLSFRIAGKILERKVEMGMAVRKGQPLFRLDPQDAHLSAAAAKAQVAVADADLAFAKAELDRSRQLLDQKFISQAAFDNKLSAYRVALAKREAASAQSQVSGNQAAYTTLVADSAGIVTAVSAEAGQVVNAGQAVAKVARTEDREIWINVAESQASALKPGVPAQVSLWSQPQKIYNGTVREVAPAADAQTRTYTAKIAIRDGDDALRWGMTANVALLGMRTTALPAGAIVVPLTALSQQDATASVWVVGAGNAVTARPVRVAQFLESGALVSAGLGAGETIVVAGVHKLNAGDVIKPLPPSGAAGTPPSGVAGAPSGALLPLAQNGSGSAAAATTPSSK